MMYNSINRNNNEESLCYSLNYNAQCLAGIGAKLMMMYVLQLRLTLLLNISITTC